MDVDESDSYEKLKEVFKVKEDEQHLDNLNNEVFKFMFVRLKDRQIKFYAFLNKEFNVLNFKAAKC